MNTQILTNRVRKAKRREKHDKRVFIEGYYAGIMDTLMNIKEVLIDAKRDDGNYPTMDKFITYVIPDLFNETYENYLHEVSMKL